MSYRKNWLNHFFAVLYGKGLSKELAQDFWSSENLWCAKELVRWRWVKLLWVYWLSSLAQLVLPLVVIGLAYKVFSSAALILGIGFGLVASVFCAFFAATIDFFVLSRKK